MLTIPFTRKIDWTLRPKIYLTEKEISDGKKWLLNNEASLNKRITMVSVLGSSNNKTLPFSYLAELLDRYVSETNSQLLFNYIPDQKNEALAIFQKCKEKTKSNILIDAFAPSLRDFLKVVVHCDAVIGNEGGAINMAKALSTPTYAIFSPWIEKHAWNNDEDGEKHIAIHLSDVLPSMIKGVKISRLKKDTVKLYKEFKPELIWPSLQTFIQRNSLDSEIDSKRSS
jgi:heptosyltransferase-2